MRTSMPSREKDSADFDLEAFIDLFDEALTSDDPSVQKTLQHLMVIAALARNHARHDHREGPMRRMFENQRDLIRRLERLESDNQNKRVYPGGGLGGGGGSMPFGPYVQPGTGVGTTWPPQPGTYPPGTIWAQGSGTAVALSPITGFGASPATSAVAERVEDLLHSSYNGSSVGANEKA